MDDPVGAVAVHLICGIWGTLAVGLFGAMASVDQFLTQLTGVAIVGAFCVLTSFIILFVIKQTMGLRVSEKEEIEGLDEHELVLFCILLYGLTFHAQISEQIDMKRAPCSCRSVHRGIPTSRPGGMRGAIE